jgi:CspA family cold shock protein
MQGVVKSYDPTTGAGIILSDERAEIFLGPGSLAESIFRTLRQGQRVVFDIEERDGRPFAHHLRFGSDGR